MATAPPGWYPDPQGRPGSQRYWSGSGWTEHVQAPGYMPPPPPPPTASGGSLAGYGQRVGGWLLDWLIVSVVSIPVAILVGGYHTNRIINSNGGGTYDSSSFGVHWWGLLVGAVLVVGYGTVFCGSNRGQTIGMMAVGVRAVDVATGQPIGYGRAFGRALLEYVLALVFFLPWVLDMLFPLWDRKNQTLHDKAVGSVVIHKSFGYP
jgi:uncharacterized RDD family membrane protein YckC